MGSQDTVFENVKVGIPHVPWALVRIVRLGGKMGLDYVTFGVIILSKAVRAMQLDGL